MSMSRIQSRLISEILNFFYSEFEEKFLEKGLNRLAEISVNIFCWSISLPLQKKKYFVPDLNLYQFFFFF